MTERITLDENPLSSFFSDARNAAGQSLEKISHDYYVIAKMQGSDDGAMGGIRINKSGRVEISAQAQKEKELSRDMQLLLLINDIEQMESQLEAKYGESFAEELAEKYLDEDTYNRVMAIEDEEERRRAIALALKQGIDDGTIDPADLDRDPQVRQWIEARAKEQELKINNELSVDKDIHAVLDADQNQQIEKGDDLSSTLTNLMV